MSHSKKKSKPLRGAHGGTGYQPHNNNDENFIRRPRNGKRNPRSLLTHEGGEKWRLRKLRRRLKKEPETESKIEIITDLDLKTDDWIDPLASALAEELGLSEDKPLPVLTEIEEFFKKLENEKVTDNTSSDVVPHEDFPEELWEMCCLPLDDDSSHCEVTCDFCQTDAKSFFDNVSADCEHCKKFRKLPLKYGSVDPFLSGNSIASFPFKRPWECAAAESHAAVENEPNVPVSVTLSESDLSLHVQTLKFRLKAKQHRRAAAVWNILASAKVSVVALLNLKHEIFDTLLAALQSNQKNVVQAAINTRTHWMDTLKRDWSNTNAQRTYYLFWLTER